MLLSWAHPIYPSGKAVAEGQCRRSSTFHRLHKQCRPRRASIKRRSRCRNLIISAAATIGNAARAQVRFERDASMMRCEMKISATAALGHKD